MVCLCKGRARAGPELGWVLGNLPSEGIIGRTGTIIRFYTGSEGNKRNKSKEKKKYFLVARLASISFSWKEYLLLRSIRFLPLPEEMMQHCLDHHHVSLMRELSVVH